MIKKIIKSIFYKLYSKDFDELYDIIAKYDYVSFDIFDTLIKRNVKSSNDIFDIVQRKSQTNIDGFKKKRIIAENVAKEKIKNREITLNDIYNELEYSSELKEELMRLEIETEKKYCTLNKEFFPIYEFCINNNKTIFLTSDMYLPKEVIEDILKYNKISKYKKLYLSSEETVTKHSGELFKLLLESEKIPNKKLVHIGDNIRSDYLIPKKLKIKSLLIRKNLKKSLFDSSMNFDYSILSSFINNNIDSHLDKYSKFGYEILGPILYSFTTYINNKVKNDKIDKIYFLARDAKLIMEVYNSRFKDEIPYYYIHVSRKAIVYANLENLINFDDLYIY